MQETNTPIARHHLDTQPPPSVNSNTSQAELKTIDHALTERGQ